jgi:hypothetical protein
MDIPYELRNEYLDSTEGKEYVIWFFSTSFCKTAFFHSVIFAGTVKKTCALFQQTAPVGGKCG